MTENIHKPIKLKKKREQKQLLQQKKHSGHYLRAHPELREENKDKPPTQPMLPKKRLGRPIEWTEERIAKEAHDLEVWMQDPNNYYFTDFALERGYTSDMLKELAKRSELFSRTFRRAQEAQERKIVKESLERRYDGNFAKFLLTNKHDYKEKTEISGDAANPLSFILGNIDGKTKDIIDVTPESNGSE